MNYKKAFWILFAIDCFALGLFLKHDSYNVFLAIASALFSYGLACVLARNKAWMLLLFVGLAVTICQISITAKGVLVQGYEQDSSTGSIVGDIAYGFKNIPKNLKKGAVAVAEASKGNYSAFKELNYRFFTMGITIPIMALCLLLKRPIARIGQRNK